MYLMYVLNVCTFILWTRLYLAGYLDNETDYLTQSHFKWTHQQDFGIKIEQETVVYLCFYYIW